MEFPAFRSEEWMKFAFAPMKPGDLKAQETSSHSPGGHLDKKSENVRPFYPPDFCLSRLYIMPSYLANFPPSGRYVHRIQQVQSSIKRALFRQSIFKIQNVEVLEMKRCKRPRRLIACEILYDNEEEKRRISFDQRRDDIRRNPVTGSSLHGDAVPSSRSSKSDLPMHTSHMSSQEDGLGPPKTTTATVSSDQSSTATSPSQPESSSLKHAFFSFFSGNWFSWTKEAENSGRQGKPRRGREDETILREERWSVDRCGSIRDYIITVTQDKATGDFFGVTVEPVALSDKLRQRYFNLFDKTSAEDE
ncbi:hypothetical protein CSUI_002791 [Cystoisospora suis]|uniref:Uncharacterized protein n=1 Tax=Cystoisospora suis TaxID=483139 RepID=A0A2C6L817_9APIC|nr:hypothetical protein CSUI_002791 [Cystoisospora suis]